MERGKGRLWFHVASVGEFNTARPLLKSFYDEYRIILTYFSSRARKYLESQKDKGYFHELYRAPIDIPIFITIFEKRVRPDVILIVERELWPFLLLSTRAPKVWLNAYSKKALLERFLSWRFSLILTKTEKYAETFKAFGCKNVVACGNLKFVLEEPPPLELDLEGSKLLVAGSTHPGEELVIKRVYERLLEKFKDLKLVIAPRHVSRAEEVMRLFEDMGASLRSKEEKSWKVLVVDTLGELFSFYRYATVAFVGGTLVPVGGHNLLEPAYFGKPVLYGPHTKKVKDIKLFLEEKGLGFPVKDEEELYDKLLELLSQGRFEEKFDLKEHGRRVFECYLSNLKTFLEKVL